MAEPSLSRTVSPTPTVSQASQVIEGLEQQLDGTHHTDELCVRYRVSFDQLQAQFRQIGSVELVYM
ncbi:MAG: hypothetical protein INR71_14835 [Terriglobus roseus]|nr:hypothetical protein [Terriglobus roseus]